MKAYIALFYPSRNRPSKFGDYLWNHELQCYVWAGHNQTKPRFFDLDKELKEFHAAADKVLGTGEIFPRPTVRFIADTPTSSTNPGVIPVEELIRMYAERSREVKCHQLKVAREVKAAKNKPPVPEISIPPNSGEVEIDRMENEGGIAKEPALAV